MSAVLDDVVLEGAPEISALLGASVRLEYEKPVVLAFDVSTSGARAGLFDSHGDEIKGSQVSLAHDFSEVSSGADADADALLGFVVRAIDIAVTRAESFVSRIDYVASCCFWHSLVGVDDQGRAVTPLLGWADTRAAEFVDQLRSRFDEAETHPRTGARFHPGYWPAKLFWIKSQQPDLFRRVKRWLSLSDYASLKFFGDDTTSVSMASATGLFNQQTCAWDSELSSGTGISIEQLPQVATSGQTFQSLTEDYAARWPLLDRAAWFPAIGDGAANNIGAGCVSADRAALMIGTSSAMRVLFSGMPPQSLPPELFCYRADRDHVVIGGALSDGGGPMEAICYRFALLAQAIDKVAPDATIVATGNALLSSPGWLQMLADVLGRPVETSQANEASLRGAALLALEAIGKIDSIETIDSPCGEIYEPDLARHEVHARAIERQQKLYEKLIK